MLSGAGSIASEIYRESAADASFGHYRALNPPFSPAGEI